MTTEFRLVRRWPDAKCYEGELFGAMPERETYTLEPPKRDEKPHCMPCGRYPLRLRWSNKHAMVVPGIYDVPDIEDAEIHPGNYPKDTLACVLPGLERAWDAVGHSIAAFTSIRAAIAVAEYPQATSENLVALLASKSEQEFEEHRQKCGAALAVWLTVTEEPATA